MRRHWQIKITEPRSMCSARSLFHGVSTECSVAGPSRERSESCEPRALCKKARGRRRGQFWMLNTRHAGLVAGAVDEVIVKLVPAVLAVTL